jgi:hypothetical protein
MQMRDMAKQSNARASQEMQMQTLGWILIKNEIEIEMGLDDKTSGSIAKAVGSDDHSPPPSKDQDAGYAVMRYISNELELELR